MRTAIAVSSAHPGLPFLGTRHVARGLRDQVEVLLAQSPDVELDFTGVNISQSRAGGARPRPHPRGCAGPPHARRA